MIPTPISVTRPIPPAFIARLPASYGVSPPLHLAVLHNRLDRFGAALWCVLGSAHVLAAESPPTREPVALWPISVANGASTLRWSRVALDPVCSAGAGYRSRRLCESP